MKDLETAKGQAWALEKDPAWVLVKGMETAKGQAWALEKDPAWALVQDLETVQVRGQALHSGQAKLRSARELDGRRTLRPRGFLLVRVQIGLRSAGLPVPAALPEGEKKS